MRASFENSFTTVFACDQERLIGMARATCNGEYQPAIYDVSVLLEYQGRGVGKMIMKEVLSHLPVENIILFATQGKEGFYRKFGFRLINTDMAQLDSSMANSQMGYLEADESFSEKLRPLSPAGNTGYARHSHA